MLDVGFTNNPQVICQNPKVTAINSCIEVDIAGQVVSDSIGPRIYSGSHKIEIIHQVAISVQQSIPQEKNIRSFPQIWYFLQVLVVKSTSSGELLLVLMVRANPSLPCPPPPLRESPRFLFSTNLVRSYSLFFHNSMFPEIIFNILQDFD